MLSVLRSYGTFNRDFLEIFKWVRLIETVLLWVFGLWTLGLYRTIFWNGYISDFKQMGRDHGKTASSDWNLRQNDKNIIFQRNSLLDTKVAVLEWNHILSLICRDFGFPQMSTFNRDSTFSSLTVPKWDRTVRLIENFWIHQNEDV